MIVVHSSVVLVLLTRAPGFEALAAKLCEAPEAVMSPVSVLDMLLTLSQTHDDPAPVLGAFLRQSRIAQRAVDAAQAALARQGLLAYGLGRWGLADAFAYGLAKALDAPLLAASDVFAKTDLRPA